MKIGCRCGAVLLDQTDALPHKAHLIPDMAWLQLFDGLDDVIRAASSGRRTVEEACMAARTLMSDASAPLWQCSACGRLYVDDRRGRLAGFAPDADNTDRSILAARTRPEPKG